jgi:CheY-like chemotaxis protein/anti-sigma regulatory factor (Ser/Thr protein kinase)
MTQFPHSPESALKILVVDDDKAMRMLLAALARQLGHSIVLAEDGRAAINVFAAEQPDVVLMDMRMPGMDGVQAMQEIRALAGERWVPILFVTVAGDVDTQVRALALGADDYLIKPVHEAVLAAKLEVARRTIGLHRQIEDSHCRLRSYHDAAEGEKREVKQLLGRLVHHDLCDPMVENWVLPAATFSGDLVTAARTPRGVLHVMLADGAGHGLAAALNVLPITPCFYTMTAKGLDIELIAATLNRTIKQQLPIDRFVAATLIAVDYAARRVRIWNGGNPPLLALNADGEVFARYRSRHLALGIVPPEAFAPEFEVFEYTEPCQLFAYSDGVVESYDAAGATGGQAEVETLLTGVPPKVRMKLLRNRLAARHVEVRAHDDMTLLLVQCGGAVPAGVEPAAAANAPAAPARKFEITLAPSEMRELDVVPMLLDLVATLPGAREHRSELSVVLSELYSNALDHGVLGLASSLKEGGDGLERYAGMRAAALRGLVQGSITILFELLNGAAGAPTLCITFRDSGTGFDFATFCASPDLPNTKPYGRGIVLLRAMSARVEYRGCGNEVSVHYRLEPPAAAVSRAA